jgi:hypothetical protein
MKTNTIELAKEQLKKGISLPLCDIETIKYAQTPIGNTLLKRNVGRPRKDDKDKAKPGDKIECKICGLYYTRANVSKHNKIKIHKFALKMDNNMRKLLKN